MNRKTDWTNWKWRLSVKYWHAEWQQVVETSGVGHDRNEALANFFIQYYGALRMDVPEKPLMPSGESLFSITFERAEVKP